MDEESTATLHAKSPLLSRTRQWVLHLEAQSIVALTHITIGSKAKLRDLTIVEPNHVKSDLPVMPLT